LAIVLNELIMNALSHGLSHVGGQVQIDMRQQIDTCMICIRDDGHMRSRHLPPYKGSGMGQQMVRTLVQSDLHGEFDFAIVAGWARSPCIVSYSSRR
jgi:two-component sensor histidine kinase